MSEQYNDIEKLLSHEMLANFGYQMFKKPSWQSASQSSASFAAPVSTGPFCSISGNRVEAQETGSSEARHLRLVASKSDDDEMTAPHTSREIGDKRGTVDTLFHRLSNIVHGRPAEIPRFDLGLPDRPMVADSPLHSHVLTGLTPRDAFRKLLGISPRINALSA